MASVVTIVIIVCAALLGLWLFLAALFRKVVPTNEVHIVQRTSTTTPYGKGFASSTYYNWPSWLPKIGVETITLPMSIFVVNLESYAAYDNGKVPFVVDIKAWFRVEDANTAAQRIETFSELKNQLDDIMRGAVRKILAGYDIENIMEIRKELGDEFIKAVLLQAKEFGVATVNIEFMDIRDPEGQTSNVVRDIMEKKKSMIEKESRIVVAENEKEARVKEIEAKQIADIREQEALEFVGRRTAQKEQEVGIATQQAEQKIKEEAALTKDKEMNIVKIEEVRRAEITKEAQIVKANEDKQTAIIRAEAKKEQVEIIAQGEMEAEKRRAQGIEAVGLADAEAAKAMQLAPVRAQIELAQEIGNNEGYMNYLLGLEEIKANREVGIEKAQALQSSDTKIIATANNVDEGMKSVMDIFSSKGGTTLGTMIETFRQTPAGEELYNKFMRNKESKKILEAKPSKKNEPEAQSE